MNNGLIYELLRVISAAEDLPCPIKAARSAVGTCDSCLWITFSGNVSEVCVYYDGTVLADVHFTLNYSFPDRIGNGSCDAVMTLENICGSIRASDSSVFPTGTVKVKRDGGSVAVCSVPMAWRREFKREDEQCSEITE